MFLYIKFGHNTTFTHRNTTRIVQLQFKLNRTHFPVHICHIHPVHMRLSNHFKTDSNRFGHHVNATKTCQTNFKPICPKPT